MPIGRALSKYSGSQDQIDYNKLLSTAQAKGITPPQPATEQPSFFDNVMSLLSRGQYATAGLAKSLLGRPEVSSNPLQAFVEGIQGKPSSFTDPSLLGTAGAQDYNPDQSGLQNFVRFFVRNTPGIVGDVALDPINLIPGLIESKAGKTALSAGRDVVKAIPGVDKAIEATSPARKALGDVLGPLFKNSTYRTEQVSTQGADVIKQLRRDIESAPTMAARDVSVLAKEIPPQYHSDLASIVEGTAPKVPTPEIKVGDMNLTPPKEVAPPSIKDKISSFITEKITNPEKQLKIAPDMVKDYFPRKVDAVAATDQFNQFDSSLRRINTRMGGAEKSRVFATKAEGEAAGVTYKPDLHALAQRTAVSYKSQAVKKFTNDMASGKIVDNLGQPLLKPIGADGRLLPGHTAFQGIKELHGFQAPTEVVKDLTSFFKTFVNPEEVNALVRAYDKVLNFWKASVTSLFPAFHARNELGNMYNMWLGGFATRGLGVINPDLAVKRMAEALAIQRGAEPTINGVKITHNLLDRLGMMSTGQFGSDVPKILEDVLSTSKKKYLNPFTSGRAVGTSIENNAKIAFFIDKLHNGKSLEEAAALTRKYLFDYGDLTPFERNVMKRIIPFYCVPDDSEILTREGWKAHHSLSIGEEVLTYNLAGDNLEWQPLENVAVFDHDEQLTTFSNKRYKLRFTPEHRWAVRTYDGKRRIVPGTELNTGHSIIVAAEYNESADSILTPEQARLYGWLLTDGYWRFKGEHCEAVIYQHPGGYLDEAIKVAGGTPRTPHPDTGTVCVPVLKERIEPLKGILQRGKAEIVPIVTRLSREAIDAMYEAMYHGDGTKQKTNGTFFFAAENPEVRDAFRVLALLRGSRTSDSNRGSYISPRRTLKIAAGSFGTEHYTGQVWCPKTPNGTWVMRQGSFVTITGNTWTRKNIPLQLESLIKQPGKPAAVAKLQHDINQGDQQDESLLPQFIKEGLHAIVNKDPNSGVMTTLSSLGLPIEDIARLGRGNVGRTLERELIGANPISQAMYALTSGRDTYRGKNIDDLGHTYGFIARNYPDPLKAFLGYKEEQVNPKSGDAYTLYTVDPAKFFALQLLPTSRLLQTGVKVSEDPLAGLSFFRLQDLNANELKDTKLRNDLKQLQNYLEDIGLLKTYTNTYIPKSGTSTKRKILKK